MSGIVGSRFNIRGSGLVGSLGTDGQVFTSSGAGAGATYEDAASGGITISDVWRVNSGATVTSTETDLTANWERADDTGQGNVGSAMTESSGVFVFPETGFYTVRWLFHMSHGGGVQSRYAGGYGKLSVDNGSTYTNILNAGGSIVQNYTTTWSQNFGAFAQFDVTNVSTFKFKFSIYSENTGDFWADTQKNSNCVHFMKLADT